MKKINLTFLLAFCGFMAMSLSLSPVCASEDGNSSIEERNTALSNYLITNKDRSLDMGGLTEEFFNKFPEYNFSTNYKQDILNIESPDNIMRVDNIVRSKEVQLGDKKEVYDINVIYNKDGSFIIDSYVITEDLQGQKALQNEGNIELNATKSTSHRRTKDYYARVITKNILVGKSTLIANFTYDGKIARCTHMRGTKQDFSVGMVWNSRPVETHPKESPYYGKVSRVQMLSNCKQRGSGALLGMATIYVSCGPTGQTYDKVTP